jgi:hypothetical protein
MYYVLFTFFKEFNVIISFINKNVFSKIFPKFCLCGIRRSGDDFIVSPFNYKEIYIVSRVLTLRSMFRLPNFSVVILIT